MNIFNREPEAGSQKALAPLLRLLISVLVTGLIGLALELVGTRVLNFYSYGNQSGLYVAIAFHAIVIGSLLFLFRTSSILVPAFIIFGAVTFLELFNHYHFIDWHFAEGGFINTGLKSERFWEFNNGRLFGVDQPLLIALIAGAITALMAPASLWVQRLLLVLIQPGMRSGSLDAVENLFQTSVVPLRDLKVKRDFGFYLLLFFVIFNIAFLTLQVISLIAGIKDLSAVSRLFINPPLTANTLSKESLMFLVALAGAFNPGIRREAMLVLIIGHVVAVGAQLWAYFAFAPNPFFPDDHPFLLTGAISDGVVIILALLLALKPRPRAQDLSRIEDLELRSPASTIFRNSLLGMGGFCAAYAAGMILIRGFEAPGSPLGAVFGAPDPFLTNSVTKYAGLATIFFFVSGSTSLRRYLLHPLITALSIGVIASFIFALMGETTIITRLGTSVAAPSFLIAQVTIDGLLLGLVLALRKMQYHVDYQVTVLSPTSADCVIALHHAFREIDQDPASSSREVLQRLNEYIAEIRSRRRGLLAFPFWILEHLFPLLTGFRPPFSTMSRDEQRWMLRRHILRPSYERAKALMPPLANLMSQIGEVVNALVSLTYFTTPRAHAQVGYVLPDARERLQPEIATLRPPAKADPAPLPRTIHDPLGKRPVSDPAAAASLLTPRVGVSYDFSILPDEVDYCILGSGAAGGVLAYRLGVLASDSSICVLERGGYYSPHHDFSDDEMRMIRMLYTEGGLQLSRTFDFTILQGEAVGGSTVVNNAICLQMPEISQKDWAGYGIDTSPLANHFELIRAEINIDELKPESVNQHVEDLFSLGVAGYNASIGEAERLSSARRLSGNFSNCLGCGLCNIGCRRLRKLSVLETYLPWAQAHGVKVFGGVGAVQCETEPNGKSRKKITGLLVRKENGEYHRMRIRKALIVAGGAIASSRFLMRSGLGGNGVGKGLSCNYAFPTLVEFGERVDAFDGVQITMFAAPDSYDAIFETTYNPPGAYSIAIPLHFRRHAEMMRAYRHGVNFGALVGSDNSGSVSPRRDLIFGRAIEWRQTEGEINRIKKALATVVRIAKAAGGERIILPTHPALIIPLNSTVDGMLAEFDRVLADKRYFNFATAHPQGGNMMADQSHDERVIDLDFRVRDCENLFVCDASVFPTGIRVNPQWTIMALASVAAGRIVELTNAVKATSAGR
jgi:choline dehydrogenase-like flavoprotein